MGTSCKGCLRISVGKKGQLHSFRGLGVTPKPNNQDNKGIVKQKKCIQCDNYFYPNNSNQRVFFCGKECRSQYRRTSVKKGIK